jgi:hypothetical protein
MQQLMRRRARQFRSQAALLIVLGVAPAQAGVVITRQVTLPDAEGKERTVTHTTMIQGDRMKTVTPGGTTLVDIDKGTMVMMNPRNKTGAELPMKSFGGLAALGIAGDYQTTGKTKTIAGYSCEEYTHGFRSSGADVSSTTCISKDAPGAAEASRFYHRMVEKIAGMDAATKFPEGLPLAEEAVVDTKAGPLPNLPPSVAKTLGEAEAKDRPHKTKSLVTSVKAEKLAAEAFVVPSGYTVHPLDPAALAGEAATAAPAK